MENPMGFSPGAASPTPTAVDVKEEEDHHDEDKSSDAVDVDSSSSSSSAFCWTLDTVPVELLLRVTTYLPSRVVLLTLPLVSRYFHAVLSNEATWKIRQHKLWPSAKYPPVSPPPPTADSSSSCDRFFWARSTLKREEAIRIWSTDGDSEDITNTLVEIKSHIACVDAVHLFNGGRLLATGSRDRSIAIHNVDEALGSTTNKSSSSPLAKNSLAHKGWIWAFQTTPTSSSYHLISGSWDNHVKYWDVESGINQPISQFKTSSAVLALSTEGHVTAVGTFDRRVILLDDRIQMTSSSPSTVTSSSSSSVGEYRAHRKCVLALGMDDVRVISCGEDGRVVLTDRRTLKVVRSIKLPTSPAGSTSVCYPKCLSFSRHSASSNPLPLCYIGDIRGNVHLVDLRDFKLVKTYGGVHSRAVQGVFHTLGSVVTCSSDGTMTVREPSLNLNPIRTIHLNKVELPAVHMLENRVALAGGDSIVRLWAPTTQSLTS